MLVTSRVQVSQTSPSNLTYQPRPQLVFPGLIEYVLPVLFACIDVFLKMRVKLVYLCPQRINFNIFPG